MSTLIVDVNAPFIPDLEDYQLPISNQNKVEKA